MGTPAAFDGAAPQVGAYEPGATQARSLASGRERWRGALISEVTPGGPAQLAGLEAGMRITHVNGEELRDVIDWDWEADGFAVQVDGIAYEGTPEEFEFTCDIERDLGQEWGLAFDGVVFDGMRLCRNRCTFCFMRMLPDSMRSTLYLRDDDYRLSFLQGNFVTLTNLGDDDVERIVSHALSPLNVSIHAVSPEVRARLMGRNAARGIEALEELLAGGIEVHAQIVLVPGENDGGELARTLDYVEARPLITSLGIVPLGFTRFQDRFSSSFGDPALSRAVIEQVRPYQRRSRQAIGRTRFQLADEFYLAAGVEPPAAEEYDGYPQYYDGIGMVRSFLDELAEVAHGAGEGADMRAALASCARALEGADARLVLVTGQAAAPLVGRLLAECGLSARGRVLAVRNDFFGGNVDVAGLLTARDVLAQLPARLEGAVVVLPDVMFNSDGLTLDGMATHELLGEIESRGARAALVVSTSPREQLASICEVVDGLRA